MSPTTILSASRFYQRWLSAAPDREGKVARLTEAALAGADFAALLAQEGEGGL
ncbi:MAG: hypothetical protein H7Z39_10460, partial [Burkholderiaceae bacterium]|nr:hypothetical protein [Burkholderiaceae bacterium]